ncbi:hypothetical protein UPYG_G00138080 [Umbra pygmaea]|uniref:TACI cysteine-rich domain-containing protein n=1 Tax=Umbra pygmaea TaxID=75934 RepID=A0ABD0XD19_UMBPY
MALGCPEGQYRDRLVRECLTCELVCQQPHHHLRCTDYCVSLGCKAIPGQYYDRLLKMCMRCAVVCGSHPAECDDQCQTRLPLLSSSPGPVDRAVILKSNTRGGSFPKALPNSDILVNSLLGLSLALLLLTLSGIVLVLLRRAKGPWIGATQRQHTQGQEVQVAQEPNPHSQSSKDCLLDPSRPKEISVSAGSYSRPTETCVCVHCFPDLRAPAWGEKQQVSPRPLYQQAVPQDIHNTTSPSYCGSSPIICSPSQPS